MTDSAFSFQLELGLLNRGSTIFEIKSAAMRSGLQCEVAEDRGLLGSAYQIRISGPTETLQQFRMRLQDWLRQQEYP